MKRGILVAFCHKIKGLFRSRQAFVMYLWLLVVACYVLLVQLRLNQTYTEYAPRTIIRTVLTSVNTITNNSTYVYKPESLAFWKQNNKHRQASAHMSCQRLFEGDADAASAAKDLNSNTPEKSYSDGMFIDLTSNCAEFRQRRGYIMDPMTREEEDFPIAYSIVFHKNLAQMERLLRAVYRPQNTYCLHLDAKSSEEIYNATLAITACFPNVFLTQREDIVYAGYSRLQAEINCMDDSLKADMKWKYYINLVGEVFPLKTNREIVKILKAYGGSNDIENIPAITSRFKLKYETVREPGKAARLVKTDNPKPDPPHNIQIARGSAYGIFSRGFVDYIVHDNVARDLLEWSRDTYSPDEFYWSTLHHLQANPHLKTPGGYSGDPLKKPWLAVYAAWGRPTVDPCLSRNSVHGVCIFGIDDLPQLVGRRELFANKFHSFFQPLTLDCLEELLYNRTVAPTVFDTYYYRQLPFAKNKGDT